jgi:hypothetical protein
MRRRRLPTPTPKEVADYEAAGQQTLPGFSPIPTTPTRGRGQRIRGQALAIAEHTAKIVQELPRAAAEAEAQPPLLPGTAPTPPKPASLPEAALIFLPVVIATLAIWLVVFRADLTGVDYGIRIAGLPKKVAVGTLGWIGFFSLLWSAAILVRWILLASRHKMHELARLGCYIVIGFAIFINIVAGLVIFAQTREAAMYVYQEAKRNVANDFTIPPFGSPDVRQEPSRRR